MTEPTRFLTADFSDDSLRLDRFLANRLPDMSRSRLQQLIHQGYVSCDGHPAEDSAAKVKSGQTFIVMVPETVASHIVAQEIALDIIYEDKHLLVINKPPGLTVHPAPGHPDMTLVNALLAHCGDSLSGIGGVARPGIVHRIDKETSGLLVVAKNDNAHLALSAQLADRSLKRTYVAVVWGTLKNPQGTITGNIGRSSSNRQKMAVVKTGGKPAITHYKVMATSPLSIASVVECKLETGRTHQIRVHFAYVGHSLVGDPVYGQPTASRLVATPYKSIPPSLKETLLDFRRQALHARELTLVHPATGQAMTFTCPIPEDMHRLILALR